MYSDCKSLFIKRKILFLTRILKILKMVTLLRSYTYHSMPYCGCTYYSITA